MEKIVEALTKLLPEDAVTEVSEAVKVELEKAKQECEQEFNSKLEEAYAELSKELKTTEETALQGYKEAYVIIEDLRKRLEVQQKEFETAENILLILCSEWMYREANRLLYIKYDEPITDHQKNVLRSVIKKTKIILILIAIIFMGAFVFLSSPFQQEVPKNTIRMGLSALKEKSITPKRASSGLC